MESEVGVGGEGTEPAAEPGTSSLLLYCVSARNLGEFPTLNANLVPPGHSKHVLVKAGRWNMLW